jgi:hypothetical protein
MRIPIAVSALLLASAAAAADYTLDLGASVQGGNLKVEPTITGPAGKTLDYEMKVRREGQGKSSNSSQGGTIHLDDGGRARLASNSVNVSPSDRYVVTVRVMDEGRVVAEKSQRYP